MLKFAATTAALLMAGVAVAQTAPAPADPSAHAGHAAGSTSAAPAPRSVDSTIATLLADPASKAVLEKHLPGVSTHPQLDDFKDMTLNAVIPHSGGRVTPEIVAAIDADLKALPQG